MYGKEVSKNNQVIYFQNNVHVCCESGLPQLSLALKQLVAVCSTVQQSEVTVVPYIIIKE